MEKDLSSGKGSITPGDLAHGRETFDWELARCRLADWYRDVARPLPWRKPVSPYRVWISEIMLQQTTVSTVLGYFDRFLARFPSVEVLAEAPLEDLLKIWEGLGYYQRARNLHRAARAIVLAGGFPETRDGWLQLPGIGPSTAGAIASIAFGKREAILDANVRRVNRRLFHLMDPGGENKTSLEPLWTVSRMFVGGTGPPGDINQALMDLGATVCTIRNPDCSHCPLGVLCLTNRSGLDVTLPGRPAPPRRQKKRRVFVGPPGTDLFLEQRTGERLLEGLWDFPGGPSGQREGPVARLLGKVSHVYTHFEEEVEIVEVEESFLSESFGAATRFPDLSRVRTVPLTGVAKKILRFLESRTQYHGR